MFQLRGRDRIGLFDCYYIVVCTARCMPCSKVASRCMFLVLQNLTFNPDQMKVFCMCLPCISCFYNGSYVYKYCIHVTEEVFGLLISWLQKAMSVKRNGWGMGVVEERLKVLLWLHHCESIFEQGDFCSQYFQLLAFERTPVSWWEEMWLDGYSLS